MSVLIEAGEEVDGKGQDGSTPLRCAVQEGQTGVVELLLCQGASLVDRDEDGLSALHAAAGEGHTEIVSLILARAPDLASQQSRYTWGL